MATQSNSDFRHKHSLSSIMNPHAINFQNSSSSEMIPMEAYLRRGGLVSEINLSGNTFNVSPSGLLQSGNVSSSSHNLDSVPGIIKSDAYLASEWSLEEQRKLEEGLETYREKPSIMKYIKIAATLPDKTVRDVALRCRWMTKKKRKVEELNAGRTFSYTKDKQKDLSSKSRFPTVLTHKMASYPPLFPHASSSQHITDLSSNAIHLLEQNTQSFSQIRANFSTYKLQDNIDLFCLARNNLITLQNELANMPSLMSPMPPLPVTINDDLASSIVPNTKLMPLSTLQGGIRMKQERLD